MSSYSQKLLRCEVNLICQENPLKLAELLMMKIDLGVWEFTGLSNKKKKKYNFRKVQRFLVAIESQLVLQDKQYLVDSRMHFFYSYG